MLWYSESTISALELLASNLNNPDTLSLESEGSHTLAKFVNQKQFRSGTCGIREAVRKRVRHF
jgi:hypothetical protein